MPLSFISKTARLKLGSVAEQSRLNPKIQAANRLLCLYSPVCVVPDRNPEDRFSRDGTKDI